MPKGGGKGIFGISGKDILNLHNLKKYNRLKTACYKYFKSKARYWHYCLNYT